MTAEQFTPIASSNGSSLGLTLTGTPYDETLNGTAFDDAIYGLAGDDRLNGLDGNDLLEGGSGYDILYGGQGNDTLLAGNDADGSELRGEQGNDILTGSGGGDRLFGGDGDDILTGGAGGDSLSGGVGNDTLSGGDGNDYLEDIVDLANAQASLDAGAGDDTIYVSVGVNSVATVVGGSGRDTYRLEAFSVGQLLVSDFAAGANGDIIDINQLLFLYGTYSSGNPFDPTLGFLRLVQQGADTSLQWDLNGVANGGTNDWQTVITLQNTDASTLTADNFSPATSPEVGVFNLNIEGGAGDDPLTGTASADRLYGHDGNDTLLGLAGDDQLNGGAGNDRLDGGEGNDSAAYSSAHESVHGHF